VVDVDEVLLVVVLVVAHEEALEEVLEEVEVILVVPPAAEEAVVAVLPVVEAHPVEAGAEQVAQRSLSRNIVTRAFSSPEERKTCWSRATWCLA